MRLRSSIGVQCHLALFDMCEEVSSEVSSQPTYASMLRRNPTGVRWDDAWAQSKKFLGPFIMTMTVEADFCTIRDQEIAADDDQSQED